MDRSQQQLVVAGPGASQGSASMQIAPNTAAAASAGSDVGILVAATKKDLTERHFFRQLSINGVGSQRWQCLGCNFIFVGNHINRGRAHLLRIPG
jgi:hypothetical protein